MKNAVRQFGLALLMAGLMAGVRGQARADITLTFDNLPTSSGGGISAGSTLVEGGYQLSVLEGNGFDAFQDGWQGNRGSSDGTTTLGLESGTTGGVAFSLSAADSSPLRSLVSFFTWESRGRSNTACPERGGIALAFGSRNDPHGPGAGGRRSSPGRISRPRLSSRPG